MPWRDTGETPLGVEMAQGLQNGKGRGRTVGGLLDARPSELGP